MDFLNIVISNLEKVGIGLVLFVAVYASNMMLGAWKNVKIEGVDFDWKTILQSVIKFIVLGLGIALLSISISFIPVYATYVGIDIGAETLNTIDSVVIIGSFLTAIVKYAVDAISKIKAIFGSTNITASNK